MNMWKLESYCGALSYENAENVLCHGVPWQGWKHLGLSCLPERMRNNDCLFKTVNCLFVTAIMLS